MACRVRAITKIWREGITHECTAVRKNCGRPIPAFDGESISHGGEPWKPPAPEVIPDNPAEQEEWLNYIFYPEKTWVKSTRVREAIFLMEAAGRRVSSVTNDPLNDLRVKIAHGLTKTAELTMSLDDATNADVLIKWLPLTKCLARLLLKHQFPQAFPAQPTRREV